jgi:tetratricopeptide (TPR) repeat protein
VNSHKHTTDGECLTEELISGYLEGSLTPVVKAACEVHLIGCDRCRESLAALMRLLRTDVDPDENAEIQLAVAEWNRRSLTPVRQRRTSSLWRRIFYAAGIAAVVALALFFGALPLSQPTAEDLVQDILQKTRPFDAQLASQPYLTLSTTRSAPADSSFEALADEMTRRAADAYRLGRFNLVRRDYDKAIQYLEKAAGDRNAPADVHNDLGVGYLQRNDNGDFERAQRAFTGALAIDSGFRPAVFNLSLLYELQGMTADAEKQWTRYLELDSSSGWAQEVRRKLSRKDFGR